MLSYQDLIDSFFKIDGESLEDYAKKCLKNGYLYTARFHEGKPVLMRLQ